jgi:hypothetical protein
MKAIELHEIVEKKIQEVCQLLTDGRDKHKLSVSSLTEKCIIDLATYGGYNHYESVGILEEAKLCFRQYSHEAIQEQIFEEEHFPIDIEIAHFPQRDIKFSLCVSQLDEPSNLDIRTELFQNYLINNDIDPIIGEVKDWFVTHVDSTITGGEVWTLSN